MRALTSVVRRAQINMDKEKEGGLTAEEASQLDQQILALENSLKVADFVTSTRLVRIWWKVS
jgi:CRISPR/Cas system type I-B associated protein Csh2 (Cas7 group RAMP superfamily)